MIVKRQMLDISVSVEEVELKEGPRTIRYAYQGVVKLGPHVLLNGDIESSPQEAIESAASQLARSLRGVIV